MASLEFQERADGYRVCEIMANGIERMIASLQTRRGLDHPPSQQDPNGHVTYEPLPRAECTVHSASGPLTVAHLDEILAHPSVPKA